MCKYSKNYFCYSGGKAEGGSLPFYFKMQKGKGLKQ